MNTAFALMAALTVFRVDPWFHEPILPDADPKCGVVTDEFSLAAAKGEYEAISFVVSPDADYAKVDVVASDMRGPNGAVIPSAAADVALVKVWFRPGGRWVTSYAGYRGRPEAINNLVLHDDALVKVDFENKVNYLRGRYSDGEYYMDMSHSDSNASFNDSLEPVSDAPKFVPFDLKKGFRQQYLVTWKVPKNAQPGEYRGTITLSTPNSQLSTLNVSLTVYPFVLPRPRTHYDTSKFYVSFWMGTPSLECLVAAGHRLDRAERKLRNILRSMVEHNAINLSGVGKLQTDSTDDYGLRTLLIARQEGMCAKPLVNGMAFDMQSRFVWSPGSPPPVPEEHPEEYRKALERHRARVMAQNALMDKYLGHHECYYSSADECGVGTNRRGYGFWSIVHELGGMVWTDAAHPQDSGAFIDVNDVPATINHNVHWQWHRTGAKAFSYAAPFTGPECPDIWRRVKGIRFWYSDLDGPHEYAFIDAVNRWNEFVYRGRYCQFGMGFWTIDGIISTLSWEAVRESLDDVKYYSLLRLRAEAALASADTETRRLGRAAIVWQDGVDPEYVIDLDAFRRETVGWILKLMAKVGPQPEDGDPELAPPDEIPPDSRWQRVPRPSAGAKSILEYAEKCGPRYDLALEALYGLFRDESAAASDRVAAAMRISALHSEMRERPQAVKAVEDALAIRGITNIERGKLLLKRVDALMTDEKFEERYSVAHLDRASKAMEAALQYTGASEAERYAAIQKMTDGYLAAGESQKSIDFAVARMEDTKIAPEHQAFLLITVGNAWKAQSEWEKAVKAFRRAHAAYNNDKDHGFRRRILITEAEAAERAKDYNLAVHCWTELIPTYNEEKDKRIRAISQIKRLQSLARKSSKMDMGSLDNDDGKEDDISLDE